MFSALPGTPDPQSSETLGALIPETEANRLLSVFIGGFILISIFPVLSALLFASDGAVSNRVGASILAVTLLSSILVVQRWLTHRQVLAALWVCILLIFASHQWVTQVGIRGLVNSVFVLLVSVTGLIGGKRWGWRVTLLSIAYLTLVFCIEQLDFIEGITGKNAPPALGCLIFFATLTLLSHVLTRSIVNVIQTGLARQLEDRRALTIAESNAKQAEDLIKYKTNLLGSVASKLKEPLGSITQVLKHQGQAHSTNEASQNDQRIAALATSVEEILDSVLNNIEADLGVLELTEEVFCIDTLIADVYSDYEQRIGEKKLLGVLAPFAQKDRMFRGSAPHIRQQLRHLLGLAVEQTDSGFVRVGASIEMDGAPIDSTTAPEKSASIIRFFVQDSSPSVPDRFLPDFFTQYSFVNDAHPLGLDAGLKLASVKRVAELMGGTAGVQSVYKTGKTLWFSARLAQA